MTEDRAPQRRSYQNYDLVRAAYWAGHGSTAEEIADQIGGTTPSRIYALLSRYGLKLIPKRPAETAITVCIERKALDQIRKAAIARRVDPDWIIGKMLEVLAEEYELLLSLIDEAGG